MAMADFAKLLLKANFPHDIMAKKTEYVSYIFIHNMPSFGMAVNNVSFNKILIGLLCGFSPACCQYLSNFSRDAFLSESLPEIVHAIKFQISLSV